MLLFTALSYLILQLSKCIFVLCNILPAKKALLVEMFGHDNVLLRPFICSPMFFQAYTFSCLLFH